MRTTTRMVPAFLFLALLHSPTRAWSQEPAVAGAWEGLWTAPEGWLYSAELHLTVESVILPRFRGHGFRRRSAARTARD